MNIKVGVKSPGRTRGVEYKDYEVRDKVKTLKGLIENMVEKEIESYLKEYDSKVLDHEKIEDMYRQGKVAFRHKYRDDIKIDVEESKEAAILAVKDGIVAVFINDEQFEELDDEIHLKDGDMISIIKLVMLG